MYISTIQQGNTVRVWERSSNGERVEKEYAAPYYFYLEDEEGEYKSIFGKRLSRYDFEERDEFVNMVSRFKARNIPVYESDISCELKVLSAHYYEAKLPAIHMAFFDIEVDYDERIGHADSTNPYAAINAVSIGTYWDKKSYVIAVPPPGWDPATLDSSLSQLAEIILVKDEKTLLRKFLELINDADVLSGWNSQFFDIPYICERLLINFGKTGLARMCFPNSRNPRKREVDVMGKTQFVYDLYGRVHLDYIDLFKKYEVAERPSYKLESISEEVLPNLPKLEYTGSLAKQYRENFNWFLRYNIRDTEILCGFEDKLGYVQVANVMAHTSTAKFNDVLGTIRLADTAIINQCHYVEDVIVPDWREQEDGSIRGAYVLYPQIGMHKKIGSIDITSLYPNAIRAVNISPETMIGQFLNNIKDFEEIRNETNTMVLLEYMDGKIEELTAKKWYAVLFERKWSISGYGTVFTQEKMGVIPAILATWYAKRKDFQRKEVEFEHASIEFIKQHGKSEAKKGLIERDSVFLTEDEAKEYDRLCEQTEYNHKLQYVYKIKLNSLYGALTNYRFRFFRLELGESTTGTGRAVLKHQCRKTAELLDGSYDVDFPLYATVEDALDNGESPDTALHGPKFNGKIEAPSVVYGDSVAGNSLVYTPNKQVHISSLFTQVDDRCEKTGKEYCLTNLPQTLSYNEQTNQTEYRQIAYIMRHKCEKRMFRVWTTNSTYVDVTEDHSLMGYVSTRYRKKYDGKMLTKIGPTDLGKSIKSIVRLKRNRGCETHDYSCYDIDIVPVRKVEEIVYDDYVYDIEVADTHTFFANDILVHNTDSTYFVTHAKTDNQARKIADYVAEQVNASYPEFMTKAFRCQPEFTTVTKCGREIVADNGIFVSKKRYILHMIDKDGTPCDKMKIMGLELKKTTLPKPVQKKLIYFVENLLRGAEWDALAREIVDYKKELLNPESVLSLGLPKGVKGIEAYTSEWKSDPTTRLPGHVAAAILYNKMLEEHGDKSSPQIFSGFKLKIFYLTKRIGRFKAIAVPTDLTEIPQWFMDEFVPLIDTDAQIERLVDKPLEKIFDAINKKVPTPQSLYLDDLFCYD